MQGKRTVALNWIGDGGTSTGAFHEGFNFACVQKAPFVLIVENNKWAYSTPTAQADGQHRASSTAPRAYGCYGEQRRRQRRARRLRGHAPRASSGRAHGRGPDAHRGRHHAHARPRRARRHEVRAAGACSRSGPRKDPIARYERQPAGRRRCATRAELDGIVARARRAARARTWPGPRRARSPTPDSGLAGVYGDREVAPPVAAAGRGVGARARGGG